MKKLALYILVASLGACSASKKIDKKFDSGEYSLAIIHLEKTLKPDNPESNFKLAEAYRKSNRIKEAEPYYKSCNR